MGCGRAVRSISAVGSISTVGNATAVGNATSAGNSSKVGFSAVHASELHYEIYNLGLTSLAGGFATHSPSDAV